MADTSQQDTSPSTFGNARDSLLIPPLRPRNNGEGDSTLVGEGEGLAVASRDGQRHVQVAEDEIVHVLPSVDHRAPDHSDVAARNLCGSKRPRGRAHEPASADRVAAKLLGPKLSRKLLREETSLYPGTGFDLAEGGWCRVRALIQMRECLTEVGPKVDEMHMLWTCFHLTGMCDRYDCGRLLFLTRVIRDMYTWPHGARSWTPELRCVTPDGYCGSHVLEHTGTFARLERELGLCMDDMRRDLPGEQVDGLIAVLTHAGVKHRLDAAARYCGEHNITHMANVQQPKAFCEAVCDSLESMNSMLDLLQSHGRVWTLAAGQHASNPHTHMPPHAATCAHLCCLPAVPAL